MQVDVVKALFNKAWKNAAGGAGDAADRSAQAWSEAAHSITSNLQNSFGGYGSVMSGILNSWVRYYELSQQQMKYAGQNSAEAVAKYNEIAAQKSALVWATVGQAINAIAAKMGIWFLYNG